jgi:sialic acid synthase SpsE
MKIQNIEIGDNRCFILAKTASSHCGNVTLLKNIIKNSVSSKVDGVKVQVFKAECLCSIYNPDYESLTQIELTRDEWKDVFNYMKYLE